VVNTQPTDFIINLSDPVDPATVQSGDFLVNDIPADSFVLSNGNTTITFHFNTSPVQNQGEQTMHIPAGAFNQASNNDPVLNSTTFRYDATLLAVTDTVPPDGGTFDPPGPACYTYDMNFRRPVDPASVPATRPLAASLLARDSGQRDQRQHDGGVHDSNQRISPAH
jgi:hypothetical protein